MTAPRRLKALVLAPATAAVAILGASTYTYAAPPATPTDLAGDVAERQIDPAPVEVSVDGRTVHVPASESLMESLAQAGITVGEHDAVSESLGYPVYPGERVTIERGAEEVVTETTILHAGTVEEKDPELPEGTREVRTKGTDGKKVDSFTVVTLDGEELSRQHLATVVVPPVDEVVAVGTKAPEPAPEVPHPQPRALSRAAGPAPARTAPQVQASPGSNQEIAQAMVADRGWGTSQFSCLVTLWNRESNWNHLAQNPSSGAYGIPQALPGSKMASHGADWRTNARTQVAWGLDYIAGRYGTPCGALDHSYARGWY